MAGDPGVGPQAKTTKKIVLRLACSVCKAVHMHPIKRCVSQCSQCSKISGRFATSTKLQEPGAQEKSSLSTTFPELFAKSSGEKTHNMREQTSLTAYLCCCGGAAASISRSAATRSPSPLSTEHPEASEMLPTRILERSAWAS